MGFPDETRLQQKGVWLSRSAAARRLYWNRGAYIMEILNLDDLAKDRAYEFLFVVGPLLLKGGIGVPINPIAML